MIRRNIKYIIVIFTAIVVLGCQRDDICPEATATTPLLLIEFFDSENPETLKVVTDLIVIADGETEPILGPVTTNNIAIPLRTDQNITEYTFVLNAGSEAENEDHLRFTYNPSLDYLNRACGFKMNFLDLNLTRETGSESWINSHIVQIDDIENEATTHILITH